MPNPKSYSNQQDWMDACMSAQKDEGKNMKDEGDRKQAVAICLNMWRDRNKKKKSAAEYIRSIVKFIRK